MSGSSLPSQLPGPPSRGSGFPAGRVLSHSQKLLYEQDQFHPYRNAGNSGVISVLVAVRAGNEARRGWRDSTNYTFRLAVGGCGIDDPPLNQTGALIKLRELLRTPRKLSKFYIQNKRPFPMPLEDSSCTSLQRHQSSFLYGKGCDCGQRTSHLPPSHPTGRALLPRLPSAFTSLSREMVSQELILRRNICQEITLFFKQGFERHHLKFNIILK